MPSEKCDSIMAIATIATGLIYSLLNVASFQNIPFCQPEQLQCLHSGLPKGNFVFLSPLPH